MDHNGEIQFSKGFAQIGKDQVSTTSNGLIIISSHRRWSTSSVANGSNSNNHEILFATQKNVGTT